jgi:hypothetical protein
MQMIENRKQCILRFFCFIEKLNIIDDQHINQLIKMNKIIDGVVAAVIHELVDEFFRAHIQHYPVWLISFYVITYCLRQVGFSQSNTAINNEWVKRISTRFLRNSFACTTSDTIAITFNK